MPLNGKVCFRAGLRVQAWTRPSVDVVNSSTPTAANLQHNVPAVAAKRASQHKQTRYAVLLA